MSDSNESAQSGPPPTDPDGSPPPRQDPSEPPPPRQDPSGSPPARQRWLPNIIVSFLLVTVVGSLITAFLQHQNSQQQAQIEQRAAVLQTYIDNMRDLLLNKNLSKSAPGDEANQVARVQTLTTLRSLDAANNKIVLQFLQDAGLIRRQKTVIDLSNADLSHDDLSGANLSGIDLRMVPI